MLSVVLDVSQFRELTEPKAQTTSCLEKQNRVFRSSTCTAAMIYRHDDITAMRIVKLMLNLVQ